jgi:hypothetical protein
MTAIFSEYSSYLEDVELLAEVLGPLPDPPGILD